MREPVRRENRDKSGERGMERERPYLQKEKNTEGTVTMDC